MTLPPPLVLAFDTSAVHCAAALLRGDDVLAVQAETMVRGQAERLMPLLQDLLDSAGVTWTDLAAIGVGIGPGNFTGVRISVSAARGLSLALGIPAVGVDSFEAALLGADAGTVAALPAPRDQFYLKHPDTAPIQVTRAALDEIAAPVAVLPEPEILAHRIARITRTRFGQEPVAPAPYYIRNADAAPPRDTAPAIVP